MRALVRRLPETRGVKRGREGTRYPGSNAKFDTGLEEAETIETPLPETGNGSLKMYSSVSDTYVIVGRLAYEHPAGR